ncbi:DEAD/DEAH box helicase [Bradyrhizobium xenonodulans]|uniref:DEAD/DEAH box helicase n=1 Tax=Bradyrhizobium xenonodulans TaxID=2736875 RepID=A0ABY7MWK4_9BRAD|nr:DEAD/DEAH box helicase [Bradyrhizobium xenonodulans]WBL82306.1 DEAD/DEAH box helicase [Bradyrhizobium xenonodulans]
MGATLRPHQTRILEQIDQAIADGRRRIMVQLPTGGGKTIIGAAIAGKTVDAGQRAIFTVPALSLVDQTVEKFYREGIYDVGVIQADHMLTNYARPIQVASVQTLQRRIIPRADRVMIDEAHRWYEFYADWMSRPEWADTPFIGLSATPWTRGLGRYFDTLIIGSTTNELIEAGFLSRFRVFAPSSPDLTGVRTLAGDYHEGDLSKAMDKSGLVADVVDTWKERGRGRPTLCFAVDRVHAKNLQQKFIAAGVVAEYIDAYTKASEREAIARRFHAGEVEVVCNVGCLTTGIDWNVCCIILARPTKSQMLFVQMIGRGLRTADGKDDCLILDHSDNHLRIGFVTDIQHDKLDDGRERQKQEAKPKEALPKKCPKCTFLKPPKTPNCPACGFKPQPKCDVVNKDGELVELRARAQQQPAEKAQFYRELRWIANNREYNSGWVAHKFKDKFGHWPNGLTYLAPLKPSIETLNWVRSKQIAYAKTRGASW